MSKREAKRIARRTAAVMLWHASISSEIYVHDCYSDEEIEMLRKALQDLSYEIVPRDNLKTTGGN